MKPLKAPFPYFGGKSRVAKLVWQRFGNPQNYIEPFCGSAAMLLLRPHEAKVETLNDADCYVANFWRATSINPESVVGHCDWPVNEADLHSRHRWLVYSDEVQEFRQRMRSDPDYFDEKIAGWWCWGLCCWIGSGWCAEGVDWKQLPGDELGGVCGKVPRLTGGRKGDEYYGGIGVHSEGVLSRQVPRSNGGKNGSLGVHGRPQLADAYDIGRGVHSTPNLIYQQPALETSDSGVTAIPHGTCEERRTWLLDWFGRLRDRLRNVRVCCGDWKRVCSSPSVTTRLGTTALFLDPPYPTHKADGTESRTGKLYSGDDRTATDELRDEILDYCRERGEDEQMRIAVCGYDTDGYAALEGWDCVEWKTNGGYGNRGGENENAARERIWFSPHCLSPVPMDSAVGQQSLF